MLAQNCQIRIPEDNDLLDKIASMFLDGYIWTFLTKGDLKNMQMGKLDFLGDDKVQKKILSNISNPEKFLDLMVELYAYAWNKLENSKVTLLEETGLPDIKIVEKDIEFFVECKNLKTINKNKIQQRIKKANKQIKNTNSSKKGAVVLDISSIVGINKVETDDLYDDINRIKNIVQDALNENQNRSIMYAILVWDDYMVMSDMKQKSLIVYRRRKLIVPHFQNKSISQFPLVFNGYSSVYSLVLQPRIYPAKNLIPSENYGKVFQKNYTIEMDSLVKTIESFDQEEVISLDRSKEIILFKSQIVKGEKPYRILICVEKKEESLFLHWAFKIPEQIIENIPYISPLQTLELFIRKFGLTFSIGKYESKFILQHQIQVTTKDMQKIISVINPRGHAFDGSFLIKFLEKNDKIYVDCSMCFVIDRPKYLNFFNPLIF